MLTQYMGECSSSVKVIYMSGSEWVTISSDGALSDSQMEWTGAVTKVKMYNWYKNTINQDLCVYI